jgi:hypothetical protein
MTDEPWLKVKRDALFGEWHMPAGEGDRYILTACDMRVPEQVVELPVDQIPLRQRCPVCQEQYTVRETSPDS